MQLSSHFSYEELTHTDSGLPNAPGDEELDHLRSTALRMETVRLLLGGRIIMINSGYRSPDVNEAVRGVRTSAHCQGWAVDFECPGFGIPLEVCEAIRNSDIQFDQLIREYGWVHISFAPALRRECLTKRSSHAPYEKGINP